MSKNLNLLLISLSLFSLIFSEIIQDEEYVENYIYPNDDGDQYFNEILKDYLLEKKLFKSDKILQADEIRKIFFDIITDGEGYKDDKLKIAFDNLIDYFIDKYYKEKKVIRGKDVYDLFNITEITFKFEELLRDDNYDEDEDEDEEHEYDNMDDVGEPSPDF